MPTNAAHDIEVRAAKTATTPKKLFDGGGFTCESTEGSKLWRMAYRFDGEERSLPSWYPGVSLKDARARRDEAKPCSRTRWTRPAKKLEKLAKAVSNATPFKGLADNTSTS